jgi:anti-anti-sigma factor
MSELSEKLAIASHRLPDGRVTVRMAGVLDAAGAARLIDATTRIDPRAGDRVVVHLDAASSLDAAGIGALCYAEAFVRARGGRFAISAPSRRVHATLEIAGLGRCCTAADDTGETPEADRRNQNHRAHQPAVPR